MRAIAYLNIAVPNSSYNIIQWFKLDKFQLERVFTSHWISTESFFIIRLILTLFSTITFWSLFALAIIYTSFEGFFVSFTTLTFIGLHAYLVTSSVHHFRYIRNREVDFMLEQPPFLNYLYQWLYSTVVVFNVLTPVVFWSPLNVTGYTADVAWLTWINVSVYGLSLFTMMTDVILNRMKLPKRMVLMPFFTILFYMFLTFIIYAIKNVWVYPFLDWNQGPKAAIWYFAIAISVVVIYFFMIGIHLVRNWIAKILDNESDRETIHFQETRSTMV